MFALKCKRATVYLEIKPLICTCRVQKSVSCIHLLKFLQKGWAWSFFPHLFVKVFWLTVHAFKTNRKIRVTKLDAVHLEASTCYIALVLASLGKRAMVQLHFMWNWQTIRRTFAAGSLPSLSQAVSNCQVTIERRCFPVAAFYLKKCTVKDLSQL